MTIREIQSRIAALYKSLPQDNHEVSLSHQAPQWAQRAKSFLAAAGIVDRQSPALWLPRLQLTGQAVEASLKACLAVADAPPPASHDLVRLWELVAEHDFHLDDPSLAMIVHLSHFYFEDLATGTRYKARFPSNTTERLGGAVPTHAKFEAIVHSLIDQGRLRSVMPEVW